jgi:hypothetical protein
MKWTLTSPDGIGDFILRLPWLIKMQEKGWKLQLIARAPTLEMALISGIEGDFVELSQSPYSMETKCSIIPFKRDFRAIQKFNPELIFFGPSHPTFLEEKLTKKFPQIKKGGFVLKEGFWPSEGLENPRDLVKNYEFQLEVSEWMSDFSRNQLACNFLLGYQETLSPYFLPQENIFNSTTSDLNEVGNKYLAVSPGSRSGDYFKGWGTENWIRELKGLESKILHPFVFLGNPNEMQGNAEIFAALSPPRKHVNLTGQTKSLMDLLGILCRAVGYVGKDSGIMHLASICKLPVLAVFGGGHRDRFFPPSRNSTSITVDVPCRGCDWRCHLSEHICVTGLTEGIISDIFIKKMAAPDYYVPNLKLPPDQKAMDLLNKNPARNFPEICHTSKKARQKEESRITLSNLPFRVFQAFLAK